MMYVRVRQERRLVCLADEEEGPAETHYRRESRSAINYTLDHLLSKDLHR